MIKKILTVCVVSLSSTMYFSQEHTYLKMPKYSIEDLKKPKSLIDENAGVEVLYRSIHYRVDPSTGYLIKKIASRVKIYNKDKAEEWLDIEIPLYESGVNASDNLYSFKGYVYNLEGDKVSETKVDKSSKFRSKENKNYAIVKYAFPNIKDGSVLEYQYEVRSPYAYEVPLTFIELNAPSVYTEYVLDAPNTINYMVDFTGGLMPKYRYVADEVMYNADSRTYRFGYDNIPAFKKEKFVKNNNNFRTKVRAEVESTFFNNIPKSYAVSWSNIGEKLLNQDDFGGQYKREKNLGITIPQEITSQNNAKDKADLIFNFVKNNYNWNQNYGYSTENGIRNTIKNKTGNVADINLLLVSLLRSQGLKAYPIILSTVDNGKFNTTFPNVGNFNYVIAAAEVGNQIYIYDATSKQSKEGVLPYRVWNDNALLLRDDSTNLIELSNNKMSVSRNTIKAKINADGTVIGEYEDIDEGLFALQAKEDFDENPEKYKKTYKENYSVDFTDITTAVNKDDNFEAKMKFSSREMIDNVGKKTIINPLLFLRQNKNDFDQVEERKYDIDFVSPITKIKTVEIEIPEGYEVGDLPKSKKIVTEDKEVSYSYVIEKEGNKIKVTSQYVISNASYPKEYYPAFKQIWKVISDNENQVISLIKK